MTHHNQQLQSLGFTPQRLLGTGNSAAVYLAFDAKQRRVAVKVPFAETLNDPARAERFANEVRLSLQLRHEHLVIGHAGVPFGAGSYLSMRYFPEGTLARWLDLGKLTPTESLRILADVAHALTFLHAQGVVHQDVKSQNVYLDAGRAALGDFGAAYFVTQGGKTAGSPFYMAPEVYRAEGTTFASDVYSLGVLAYELLAHERPFYGDTYEALMAAHLTRYPRPLTNLVSDLPRSLAVLVERSMSKAPNDRPEARLLAQAFERALGLDPELSTSAPGASATPVPNDEEAPPVTRGRHDRHGRVAPATPAPEKPATTPARSEPERPARSGFWNPFKKRER